MGAIEGVFTENAPKPLPQFSQAVKYNGMVYVSGNIGLDATTWKLVEGTVKDRTVRSNSLSCVNDVSDLDNIVSRRLTDDPPAEASPAQHRRCPGGGRERPQERRQGQYLSHEHGRLCYHERGVGRGIYMATQARTCPSSPSICPWPPLSRPSLRNTLPQVLPSTVCISPCGRGQLTSSLAKPIQCRTCVAVHELPFGTDVEIECTAFLN